MNQSGRMEATRRALDHMKSGTLTELFHGPALAEVEEWETRLAALAEVEEWETRLAQALRDVEKAKDFSYASHRQRAEAAEAEADRLKAALKKITDAYTAETEDHNDGEFALWKADDLVNAIVAARAALAPADRNTT